jgi:hypothetical protein
VGADERAESSGVESVLRVRSTQPPSLLELTDQIAELERLAHGGDVAAALRQLGDIVPAFRSASYPLDAPIARV